MSDSALCSFLPFHMIPNNVVAGMLAAVAAALTAELQSLVGWTRGHRQLLLPELPVFVLVGPCPWRFSRLS